ncbi:hypothetical protein BDZ45DRAFT_670165 [Acephala macrosclerotiorum]|nr:hypothetical protein BDZ45DRAFT_670165 [Acephala macrosclerotiorum]
MVKTTSKRKSESALPTGKSKQRRTSASKHEEPDSSQDAGGSSDHLLVQDKPAAPKYVKKTAVKSRKSEPARMTRNDEYEEDEGRMESQQFLALVEFESKKKKRAAKAASEYMDKFKDSINSSSDNLKLRLTNLTASSVKQTSSFLSTYQSAYALSRPLPPPSKETPSQEGECFVTLFDRSQSLINSALSLVTHFESANSAAEHCQVPEIASNKWDEQNQTAAGVLAVGHNVNLEKYQALLQGGEEPGVDEDIEGFAAMICDGVGLDKGEEGKKESESKVDFNFEYGWGKVARKGEKAARKFIRFQRVGVA